MIVNAVVNFGLPPNLVHLHWALDYALHQGTQLVDTYFVITEHS